jgi:four helix bundle protein
MGDYRSLDVWQNARKLAVLVYQFTAMFPSSERFGLVSQIRRAAVSIPSNIAEAHGRDSDAERVQFLRVARGSVLELQTQALISGDLGFLDDSAVQALVGPSEIVVRQLNRLIQHYRTRSR